MKPVKFKINSGIFPFDFEVLISSDYDFVYKYMNHKLKTNFTIFDFKYDRGRFTRTEYATVLWLDKRDDIVAVNHEMLHAAFDCLSFVGVKYCKESEEAFTHLHHYYVNQYIKKAKIKIK